MRARVTLSCLLIGLAGLAFSLTGVPSLAAERTVVSGLAWYDDNRNGTLDPGEEPAPQATVVLSVYGAPPPPPRQPRIVTEVAADATGRFEVAFESRAGDQALLRASALRPGYPYYPCRPEVGCVGFNYGSGAVGSASLQVPLDQGPRVRLNVALAPWPGVLERLPPGSDRDFSIDAGRFFTQTNGLVGDSALGFSVTNSDGIPFWDTWESLGLDNVGYPLSRRFVWAGYLVQVFQKAVFQWQPGQGVFFVNVFDELHNRGFDHSLYVRRSTPLQIAPSFDTGKSWDQIVRDRLALLDANPDIKARYFAAPDPLLLYGLPTSRAEDFGPLVAIRTQRTVLQQWKVDVPWARAGEVTIANGGEIAKEMAIFPWEPLSPELPPAP